MKGAHDAVTVRCTVCPQYLNTEEHLCPVNAHAPALAAGHANLFYPEALNPPNLGANFTSTTSLPSLAPCAKCRGRFRSAPARLLALGSVQWLLLGTPTRSLSGCVQTDCPLPFPQRLRTSGSVHTAITDPPSPNTHSLHLWFGRWLRMVSYWGLPSLFRMLQGTKPSHCP